jgi:hypothetical protein
MSWERSLGTGSLGLRIDQSAQRILGQAFMKLAEFVCGDGGSANDGAKDIAVFGRTGNKLWYLHRRCLPPGCPRALAKRLGMVGHGLQNFRRPTHK